MIRFPWTDLLCPHAVIEVNATCNISCRGCYKKMTGSQYSIEQIKKDVDTLINHRLVQTLSLAGGEPLLHPQLEEIVSYIRSRNVKVDIITNALLLTNDRLRTLKNAGLNVVMIHIDRGQTRPDLPPNPSAEDVAKLRKEIADRVDSAGIEVGLSVTMYPEDFEDMVGTISTMLKSPNQHYLLGTQFTDYKLYQLKHKNADKLCKTSNLDVLDLLKNRLNLVPFGFIDHPNTVVINGRPIMDWLTYFAPVFIGKQEHHVFNYQSNRIDLFLLGLVKFITGKYVFFMPQRQIVTVIRLVLNLVYQKKWTNVLTVLRLWLLADGKFYSKNLIFDNSVEMDNQGHLTCLSFCPNATVRDGKIMHLCTIDQQHSGDNN